MKRRFTLLEVLCVMTILIVLMSGAMAATMRLMRYQKEQLKVAWAVQQEGLIAERWRRFAAELPTDGVEVSETQVAAAQMAAYAKGDLLILGKWQRLLPTGTTVRFAESADAPGLLSLTLTNASMGEEIQILAARARVAK